MVFIYFWSPLSVSHSPKGRCRSLLSIALYLMTLSCSGCSTWSKLNKTEQGALLGTGAGAAIGGASGGTTGVIIGGAAGGLAGGLIGHELETRAEQKEEEEEKQD